MINTIGSLVSGKPVEAWYKWGDEKWSELIAKHGTGAKLSTALATAQSDFENFCGDIAIGKEIMAITGIAHYYTQKDGFSNPSGHKSATEIYHAIANSLCSIEVHSYAKLAADILLLEIDEQND